MIYNLQSLTDFGSRVTANQFKFWHTPAGLRNRFESFDVYSIHITYTDNPSDKRGVGGKNTRNVAKKSSPLLEHKGN